MASPGDANFERPEPRGETQNQPVGGGVAPGGQIEKGGVCGRPPETVGAAEGPNVSEGSIIAGGQKRRFMHEKLIACVLRLGSKSEDPFLTGRAFRKSCRHHPG